MSMHSTVSLLVCQISTAMLQNQAFNVEEEFADESMFEGIADSTA